MDPESAISSYANTSQKMKSSIRSGPTADHCPEVVRTLCCAVLHLVRVAKPRKWGNRALFTNTLKTSKQHQKQNEYGVHVGGLQHGTRRNIASR